MTCKVPTYADTCVGKVTTLYHENMNLKKYILRCRTTCKCKTDDV